MPRLVSSDDAVEAQGQHTQPCEDCPMARTALPAWLGGSTPEDYCRLAHSDHIVGCHTLKGAQCAGMAIYRSNVVKRVDPPGLRLPADHSLCFSTPMEFLEHHRDGVAKLARQVRKGK